MTEYHEMVKEAAEARIGADRMAMGLSCIPDPLRGDMVEIERLRAALMRIIKKDKIEYSMGTWEDGDCAKIALRALETKP